MVGVIVLVARPAADVRVDRPRRHARQRRDGRRLRGHARRRWCSCGGRCPATIPSARRTARSYMATSASPRSAGSRWPSSDLPVGTTFVVVAVLIAFELAGPFIAERKGADAVAPAPHRRALRPARDHHAGRGHHRHRRRRSTRSSTARRAGRVDAALLAVAGVGLTFGCWWMYFAVPWAEPLVAHRERAFLFGYGHLVIFAALAAMGARPARRRLQPRGRGGDRRDGDRAQRRDPVRDLRRACSTSCTRCCMRAHDPFHLRPDRRPRPPCSCWRSCSRRRA